MYQKRPESSIRVRRMNDSFSTLANRTTFRFLSANSHSRNTLKITRVMLQRLLTYHQVMYNFIDFIGVFGMQESPKDIRFSSFREQVSVSGPIRELELPTLGRTGHQYQILLQPQKCCEA